jgi:hypothetical protein
LRTGGEILFGQTACRELCERFVAAVGGSRTNYFELVSAGVAASRQSAANRTGAFQMAAFCRKPLHQRGGAKLFHLFDDGLTDESQWNAV